MSYLNSLTRLLAEENLIIVEGNFKTASIDIETRVVRVPSHYNHSTYIQVLFRAHEVGHALYTPMEGLHEMLEKDKKYAKCLFPYINIVEDVRIEKMIQMKFPGLRKDFTEGYKELYETGLFGTSFRNGHANDQHFADRVNVFFKLGATMSGVKFDAVEKKIVDMVDSCITFEEVLHAAKVLYEYCKETQQDKKMQKPDDMTNSDGSSGGFGDQDESQQGSGGDEVGEENGDGEAGDTTSTDCEESKEGSSSSAKQKFDELNEKAKKTDYHKEEDKVQKPKTFDEKEKASEIMASSVDSTCFNPVQPTFGKFKTYKTLL